MSVNIGGIKVGGDNPCRFVAELGNAHNQSLARCLSLITAARDAGADLIKLQCYTPNELIALRGDGTPPEPWAHMTMRELYSRAQTPHDWFAAIAEYCRDLEIPWFSSVFGAESLALLESLNCPAYKIARLDVRHDDLTLAAKKTGKPLIVSRGPRDTYPAAEPTLTLWCPEGYPQKEPFFSRPIIFCDEGGDGEMYDVIGRGTFDDFDGFSYHGTDPLPCIVAATLGAKLIEAHFMLDHAAGCASTYRIGGPFECNCGEPSELEANVSLTPSAFAEMVQQVRRIEGMMA